MREIEVKLKLADTVTVQEVLAKLQARGLGEVTTARQIDTVFLQPEQINTPITKGSKIMRVRDVCDAAGKICTSVLTLKIQKYNKLESDECEFEVTDGVAARKLLCNLGWKQVATVDKVRTEGPLKMYRVCIDEVLGLGTFIELEYNTEDATSDAAQIQHCMRTFLNSCGIEGEPWTTPYDTSLREMMG